MKFKYKKIASGIIRPIIPIKVANKGQSLVYEVLVDSGADQCIFDAQIGEAVGIDIKSGKKDSFAGISGTPQPAWIHKIDINIGGWPYKIPVMFAYTISHWGHGIVGQRGFFEFFKVKFDFQKGEIELIQK